MFKYYFTAALKKAGKYSGFTALNITGLALGISSCLLIILYVNFELGFDKFHKNGDNIYRVVMRQPGNQVKGSTSDWWIVSPFILKPTLEKELPEIELACRTTTRNFSFENNDQYFNESITVSDPEFFKVFTFPLGSGNKEDVLVDPYSIIVSPKMALKYFGETDPAGKTIRTNDSKIFTVTGVLEEMPENTHLKIDFLISFSTLESINGKSLLNNNWLDNGYQTYLLLKENSDLKELDAKLGKYDVDGFNDKKWSFHLQPLYDIHFNREIRGSGDKETLFILISVGFFILFITGFNYMNLYIAHYRSNLKNLSIRKFSGADRTQLMLQFLSESFLLVFISFMSAIAIVWLALPLFNKMAGEQLSFESLWDYKVLVTTIAAILSLAFVAGMYPAIYLSKLRIVDGIKGGMEKFSGRAMLFRKAIMVIQFSISILLVVGTMTIFRQLKYIDSKNLGYNKESILYMRLNGIWYKDKDGAWKSRIETLKQELLRNSEIIRVAGSSGIPSQIGWSNIPVWEGQAEGDNPFFYRLSVDENFFDLYGLGIVQGRGFSAEMPGDKGNAYILNEAAVRSLDFNNPVGSGFGFDKKLGTVIGVAKDFHFESLHKPVTPLGIGFSAGENINYLSVKIKGQDIPGTIRYIDNVWRNLTNNVALNYSFIDENLNQQYSKETRLAQSLKYFSFLGLFISCLGIFGLISILIREKTKELGIRKVVGAPFPSLVLLLLRDNFVIIAIASVIGGIIGRYIASQWLNNFAYHVSIGVDILIMSSLITFLMAVVPVSFKLWIAVTANPVKSLMSE